MRLGWAPDLRRGGILPLPVNFIPVIREKLGPISSLHPSSIFYIFARLGLGKFFSETRLPFPLFPYPQTAWLREGG